MFMHSACKGGHDLPGAVHMAMERAGLAPVQALVLLSGPFPGTYGLGTTLTIQCRFAKKVMEICRGNAVLGGP